MAVDYATLKKGGFMRQKQKNHFSLRLRVIGGQVTTEQLAKVSRRPSGLRKTIDRFNSLAHRTTWLRSDF